MDSAVNLAVANVHCKKHNHQLENSPGDRHVIDETYSLEMHRGQAPAPPFLNVFHDKTLRFELRHFRSFEHGENPITL